MKHFARLNITDNHILDEISYFVKCHVDFIWLYIPDDFTNGHMVDDILAICEGETAIWLESRASFGGYLEIDGKIYRAVPENTNRPWAGIATSLAEFKNMELAGAKFILIEHADVFNPQKPTILGNEGISTLFEDESYGWSILSVNTPIYIFGKLNKDQEKALNSSTFVEGYEIV